jgi:hypothetical protein
MTNKRPNGRLGEVAAKCAKGLALLSALWFDIGFATHAATVLCLVVGVVCLIRSDARHKRTTLRSLSLNIGLPLFLMLTVAASIFAGANVAERDAQRIADACDSFRENNGRYPERLDELVPRYMSEIPRVGFSWYEFVYYPSGVGHELVWMVYPPSNNGQLAIPRSRGTREGR